MPSGASDWDRFFVRLLRAAFGCGVRHEVRTLPLGGVGRDVDDPGERPAAEQGQGAANRANRAEHPDIEGGPPLVVVEPVEGTDPDVDRSRSVDEDLQGLPPFAQTVDGRVDLAQARQVRCQGDALGAPFERSVATVSSRASLARASTATRAPSRAKVSAAARPIPREPPTTSTRASASPRSTPLLLSPRPCAPQSLKCLANPVWGQERSGRGDEYRDSSGSFCEILRLESSAPRRPHVRFMRALPSEVAMGEGAGAMLHGGRLRRRRWRPVERPDWHTPWPLPSVRPGQPSL